MAFKMSGFSGFKQNEKKTRINPKTGKHEMLTNTKINPVTGEKEEKYSAY